MVVALSPLQVSQQHKKCSHVQYDKNRSLALEFEELRSVLGDLGMLVGVAHARSCKLANMTAALMQCDILPAGHHHLRAFLLLLLSHCKCQRCWMPAQRWLLASAAVHQ